MRRFFAVLALVLVAGCVNVGTTLLRPGLAPVSETSVTIFLPGDSVPEHERVAILEADYNDMMSGTDDVLNKLRAEAAKLGANGVVLAGYEAEGAVVRAMRTATTGAYLGGRAKVQAIAILYR